MRLHDFLDYHAREHPDATFAIQGDRSLDYARAYQETCRIANALVDAGLEVGDRLSILSKNSIEMALLYYACSRAGVVPVPLNYRLAPPEWAYIIEDSDSKLLVAQPELADAVAPVLGQLDGVGLRVTTGTGREGWLSWSDFVGAHAAVDPGRWVKDTDDCYQMYTSGTTGRPKGAILTHAAVTRQLHQAAVGFGSMPGERTLIVAPMYHAAAGITTFVTVQAGGSLYIQEDFDPKQVVSALSEQGLTMALLVPAMIQFCLIAVPDIRERRFDDLRLIVYGASPIAEQTLRDAIEVFGCDFLQGYGMTETTAAACYLLPSDHRKALAGEGKLLQSAGRAMLGTEIRIVDDDDNPVPNGTIGEICVRGPQLMRGYWNLEEASEKALKGGWMHTGDAGIMDDDGYLYIQDRVKDMIVSGGENVYPREVEDVLYQHPAVAEAAVIGIPSDQWGEEVKAIIVKKEGADASAEDIMAFCKDRLGGYKRPRSVDFIDALPRNPSGKVLKKDLREPYWAGHHRRVG
jgi:acyl-CoA synthetase (AMP-forming)/AMP-acid ligase II